MIRKEKQLGHIAGPFLTPPFHDLVVSPLGPLPKKETGTFRLIHDLSLQRVILLILVFQRSVVLSPMSMRIMIILFLC